jgi:NAD(P)-dependent dehydrogenase (short-subunit alcohol dehydrogenase family)
MYSDKLFSVADKTVIVTGAAGGLGEQVCRAFGASGAHLALVDVDAEKLKALAQSIESESVKVRYYGADVRSVDSLNHLMEQLHRDWPRLDVLVNCAGINRRMPIFEFDDATADRLIDTNLKGLFQLSRRVAGQMKEQGGGRIINFGSLTTHMGLKNVSIMTATKCAVVGLTKVMAIEWAPYNILVNCVSPGFFVTPMNKDTIADEGKKAWMLDKIALNRLGEPEDIVGAVLFLASPAANYITGINLYVDGGATAGGRGW